MTPVDGHHVEFRKFEERGNSGARIVGGLHGSGIGGVFETPGEEVRQQRNNDKGNEVANRGRLMKVASGITGGINADENAGHDGVAELCGMFQAQVRQFVGEDVVHFRLGHALQEKIGEGDGVSGAREGVGELPFA